jgi:hypothetical protein
MREASGIQTFANTITAEPASGLAEKRLDVGRRERPQRLGHWNYVSRLRHGHFPID